MRAVQDRRHRVVAGVATAALALTGMGFGYNLTLAGGHRQARVSVALIAREVPGTKRHTVSGCRHAGRSLTCRYQLFIRALSGGTIVCTGEVIVHSGVISFTRNRRIVRRRALVSSFPGRVRCVRKPPPHPRGTG